MLVRPEDSLVEALENSNDDSLQDCELVSRVAAFTVASAKSLLDVDGPLSGLGLGGSLIVIWWPDRVLLPRMGGF